MNIEVSRRHFMKLAGTGAAGTAIAAFGFSEAEAQVAAHVRPFKLGNKCVLCSSTERISFREIEGRPSVKAEVCETCRGYVKVLYQVNNPVLEPMADDVATVGLDMLLAEEGWKRGG